MQCALIQFRKNMNADEISIHSGSDSDFAPYDDEESKRDELTGHRWSVSKSDVAMSAESDDKDVTCHNGRQ